MTKFRKWHFSTLCLVLVMAVSFVVSLPATVQANTPDPTPVVQIGQQHGRLIEGQPGSVTFPVVTYHIPDGTHYAGISTGNDANVAGINQAHGGLIITNGTGTLTVHYDGSATSLHSRELAMWFHTSGFYTENEVWTNWFVLTIEPEEQLPPYVANPRMVAESTFDGRRYELWEGGLTWDQARQRAQSLGGDLAVIRNAATHNFIHNLITTQSDRLYHWVGGYRIADTGANQFAWVSDEPMTFTNWGHGEPNNMGGIEDRLAFHREGHWNDLANFTGDWYFRRLGFIVEFPIEDEELPIIINPPIPGTIPEFTEDPQAVNNGVWMEFTTVANNRFGYRIFRAASATAEGISISDFPIMLNIAFGTDRIITFDPNVRPNTDYWYYIREVQQEARFDAATTTLIPEVLGPPSTRVHVRTPDVPPPPPERGFVMMFIGNTYMNVNNVWEGIDPPTNNTAPVISSGRTMVPIRAIVQAMGGTVGFYAPESRVELDSHGNSVRMWLGQRNVTVNNDPREMDVVPEVVNGRTLIPVRFVAEFLGAQIEWIGSQQMVVIVYELQHN